ncbi:sensor histidine kinase [Formosa undariae]|uniref:Sensor histidine kinase n=1 Tax=Formosa undariae TaxID=1325436 RepID=A0ABV5EWM8_9FLAO
MPLITMAQVSILPTELSEYYLGSWINNKNEVVLIVSQDYIVINNELFYYNEILKADKSLNFTCTYNSDIKYINVAEIDETRIVLDEGYKISTLTKAKVTDSKTLPESLIGNWHTLGSTLNIKESELSYFNTVYKIDYAISLDQAHYYLVLYENKEYYFAHNYTNNNEQFINTHFSETVVFKKESFIQKYIYRFISIIIIAFLILSYCLFKWKLALTKKKETTKRKFTEMQLKGIRSQMNPHFIFNALSAIQNLINKGDNEKANHYLTEFAQLMRLTLDKSDKGLVPLDDEISSIKKYLELEKLRFYFEYHIIIDPELDLQLTEIPAMLIQPFVENAIVHGLNEKQGDRQLKMLFNLDVDHLVCTIIDNGIGIEKAQTKKTSHYKREKYGIRLAKDRIDLINESYNTNAKVIITDASEHDTKNTGTYVEIYMPLTY